MRLPIELINYCLDLANTGTILIYNKKTMCHEIYIDRKHPKHFPLFQLLGHRSKNMNSNSTLETNDMIFEFPYKKIPETFDYPEKTKYYVSQLRVTQSDPNNESKKENTLITWDPYILTEKTSINTRNRSYSLDIPFSRQNSLESVNV
jgi:hypothetical protein